MQPGLTQVLSDGSRTYLYGEDRIAQQGASIQYFRTDGLGSVRQLYNSSGNIIKDVSYSSYGSILTQSGNRTSKYGLWGEDKESYISSVYLPAGYYDSSRL